MDVFGPAYLLECEKCKEQFFTNNSRDKFCKQCKSKAKKSKAKKLSKK